MRRTAILLGLAIALVVGTAPSTPAQRTAGEPPLILYNPQNHHYYQTIHVPGGLTWMGAYEAASKRTCLGVPGHLVTLTSDEEQRFVTGGLAVIEGWMGYYRDHGVPDFQERAGGWRWITGEPWTFTAWNEGEPNNDPKDSDFAHFAGNGRWNDDVGSVKDENYVVEYDTTGPDPSHPPASATEEIQRLLTRVGSRLRGARTYSATLEFSFKAHVDTLAAIRVNLTIQQPGRFRMEGRGNNGSMVALSDGRQYLIARTHPEQTMRFLVKPLRSLPAAVHEALSLLIEAPMPPSITDFVLGTADPHLWAAAGRIGELQEGDAPEQAIRSSVNIQFLGEDPTGGDSALRISLKDATVRMSEYSFRYKAFPFSVRETQSDIRINQPVPPDTFAFVPTAVAMQVDDLGERTDEFRFVAPPRR